jgi:hypothetical protein
VAARRVADIDQNDGIRGQRFSDRVRLKHACDLPELSRGTDPADIFDERAGFVPERGRVLNCWDGHSSAAVLTCCLLVPEVGIEPTLPEGNGILSPARLPVSPLRPGRNLQYIAPLWRRGPTGRISFPTMTSSSLWGRAERFYGHRARPGRVAERLARMEWPAWANSSSTRGRRSLRLPLEHQRQRQRPLRPRPGDLLALDVPFEAAAHHGDDQLQP